MGILVFDIETIPDTKLGKRLFGLDGLSDDDIAKAMITKQVQKTGGSEFLPLHQHRVIAISVLYRKEDKSIKLWSLGNCESDEKELVQRFFDGIAKMKPNLVSWNGSGFDLPVLHYRSLMHGVNASRYWERGERDNQFRYSNYLSRYHWRHIDLMDVLSSYNLRGAAPLDQISLMIGLPGKMGMEGKLVWNTYLEGNVQAIRNYCETDVLNTYLIYLKWELISGELNDQEYASAQDDVRTLLLHSNRDHLQEYLKIWQETI
ncbi:MAG: 3'-5' exonuclease [Gammaproteobacteria bacterium]|nr:3'-5' exonuclease [Gammaproteobacteria bacterium]MCY4217797.1 3'-5' exonuclease [Gammaproteobacteria bacterium]MCY4274679.1 3'-5' exonuclease [Gammaproteobacteria bacterium]